jgi:small-conductance mechanosensitive channel
MSVKKKLAVFFLMKSILILLTALSLFTASLPSQAETLAEYQHELLKYQAKPLDRINELSSEISKMRGAEEGLARQYSLPVSSVLKYEIILGKTIHTYSSLYFLQRQGTSPTQFIIDEGRMDEFTRKAPPYSFLYYIGFLEDVENCQNQLSQLKNLITDTKAMLNKNAVNKADAERGFRLCNEKINSESDGTPQLSLEMLYIKAKLEECSAAQVLYATTITVSEADANETGEKLKQLEPVLDKIRANIKFDSDDFTYLNNVIFQKNKKLSETVSMLDAKFRSRNEIKDLSLTLSPFTRYKLSTEQQFATTEISILLDIIEKCSSLRLTWRGMQDLLEDKLNITQQKNLLTKTNSLIDDINGGIQSCVDSIQSIRETERAIARRFGGDNETMTSADIQERDEYLTDLDETKSRYLSYIVDMGEIRDHYIDLQQECSRILKEQDAEEKIHMFWYDNFAGLSDFELWHIEDYPITVGILARAIFIFLAGVLTTRYLVRIYRKKTQSGMNITRHSDLMVQKFIYYTGFVISFIVGLWSLRIPLTAFAFLGGAMAIAFGLGTQKFMGDIFSGIILLFQMKLRIGDEVIIGQQQGIVEEITLQNTVLRCQQSNHLIIPNSKVIESPIINLTLNNPVTRTELSISIAYNSDVDKAMGLMRDILSKDNNVLKYPPFKILFEDFERSSIKLTAQFFINLKENIERDVQSSIRQKILVSFIEEKIEMPFQQTGGSMPQAQTKGN